MYKKKDAIFKAAGIYVAVVLGAGFASGQEIMSYFVDYGPRGFWGLLVSSVLFALAGWAIWDICLREGIASYKEFMDKVMGKTIGPVIEVVLGIFMFIVFSTMLAGAGASIQEAVGLPFSAGVYIAATLCFIAFLFDMSGIVQLNAFLAPVMIIGCILVGVYTYAFDSQSVFNPASIGSLIKQNWLGAGILYASYNLITAVAILASMKDTLHSRKGALQAGMISGALLGALGLSLALALNAHYDVARQFEIPMLALVHQQGPVMETAYLALFLVAVFTTAATNGFAVIEWLHTRYGAPKGLLKLGVALLGVAAAYGGFSNLVANVYPLFGIAGAVELLLILYYFLRRRKRGRSL